MTKKIYLFLIALLCVPVSFFLSVVSAGSSKEITISAAMSLKNAFEELGKQYESGHKGSRIMFNFGASGDLIRQIEGGAPVDAFASASQKELDELEKRGLLVPGSRIDFASNTLVLVTPLHPRALVKTFADLASDRIKKIAVGNPKTVPAGRYAAETLQYYGIMPVVKDKLVFAENVRQVLDYVARGEVDVGIVYSTDYIMRAKNVAAAATAAAASHEPIIYPFALIKGTNSEALAREFASLLISAEGRKILKKHGFVIERNKNSRPVR